MVLILRNKPAPDIGEFSGHPVGTGSHDIVRENIVVSQRRNNWDNQIVRRVIIVEVVGFAENSKNPVGDPTIQIENLRFGSRDVGIVVVSCRVAGPDDKVNLLR